MALKVGDHVRIVTDFYAPEIPRGSTGTVVEVSGRMFPYLVRVGVDAYLYRKDEVAQLPLEPEPAPRGPKPLAPNGGQPRFTVAGGRTLRSPGVILATYRLERPRVRPGGRYPW